MTIKKYHQIYATVSVFLVLVIFISIIFKLYLLTFVSIFTGILFFSLIYIHNNNFVDERELSIQEKAANITYSIFAPTIGLGTFLLLVPSHSGLKVFSQGEFLFLESIGTIFAFLSLFLIVLYSISYFFLAKKFGGNKDEE